MVVAVAAILLSLTQVFAGEADVVSVDARQQDEGTWQFSVAVRHADEGWEHYADKWIVVGPDGTVYGERVLAHPHVDEQPFTRSQSGIRIPEHVSTVVVKAHDSVHEFGGVEVSVDLDALR
ncbi:hypothetical protein HTY61_06890 [Oricola thermophila]|uniref:Uncharacterized protein n=1 Tax=Oricola thermophila TaxID=2742145 RepID=A0A6N1VHW0_9HYPH|nr:hypothetical protein HTY61_06890 [Oricola thermophila]